MFRLVTLPWGQAPFAQRMTLNSTIHRTVFLLVCVTVSALWVWVKYSSFNPHSVAIIALICLLGATALVWVTVYNKQWSFVTAPAVALLEGLAIGGISARLEVRYHGIAIQAVALTFTTCLCLLVAYRSGIIRVTEKFKTGLLAATSGVALFYLVSFCLSFLGVGAPALAGGVPGVLVSVVVVAIAGLNLAVDFDFIEQSAQAGLPRYMEWYASLGLMVTLVWLYMEILSLLTKARRAEEGN